MSRELSFPSGQGGLPTLRLSMLLRAEMATGRPGEEVGLHYRDDNYRQRPGWREIVVRAAPEVSLLNSTAPQQDRSDELRSYPDDLLSNPPGLSEAHLTLVAGDQPGRPADSSIDSGPADLAAPDPASSSGLTSLITAQRLSWPVIMLALLLASGLGAAHALTPGHGKTIMAAYLVGTRGTAWHALFLGFTVTVSHTLGVLGLGLVTLYFSTVIAPERLYPWLGLVSGITIVGVGIWLLTDRLRHRSKDHHVHDHDPEHHAHHHHTGSSGGPQGINWKNLAALGAANGLVPSASALIILLAAIALHRIGIGLLLVLAFSAGMAAVLSGIGIILVYCGRVIERFRVESAWSGLFFRLLPIGTAAVILISGLVVATRAVRQVGLI
jgi:ABC-type nickel/cobalt efflux system permease component RcnA